MNTPHIDSVYAVMALIGMAAVTVLLRALPFVAARWLQSRPWVDFLGRFLPPAIMTLLLLHTIKGSAESHSRSFAFDQIWMELAAVALTSILQWRWRQPLPSILGGTLLYVALRNL
jgi:branched-subunit amino acid transport protein AzlD